jgi:hypothetical protein
LAKRDKVTRRRLTQFALKLAGKELTRAKLDGFNGSPEEGAVKAGFESMEPVASDGALPMAERAMKAIESGLVAGPYEHDPVNQKDDVGY